MKISKRVQMILLILLLMLCSYNIITDIPVKREHAYNISVVIRGKMDDSWNNIKKGVENAAEDLNVTLRFVAAIDGNTAEEQIELLKQEADGTDAIILSPVNRTLLKDTVKELEKKTPMILMESDVSGLKDIPVIQSDNEAIGMELAEVIVKQEKQDLRVLVLSGNAMCSSVIDRQKGFMKVMEEADKDCSLVTAGNFEPEGIYTMMKERRPNVVVAMDTKILENLVKGNRIYKETFKEDVAVYGYGCSSTVLKNLENGEIELLAADDGFAMGYLCVQEAVKAIEHKKAVGNDKIRYIITSAADMYSVEHEKLLFPFVK